MKLNLKTYSVFVLFAIIGFALNSCKSKKHIVTTKETDDLIDNYKEVLKEKATDWSLFTSKAKIDYSDGSSNVSANATLRMKRDSIVWASISIMGFEAARVLVNKDSFYLLQKLPKKSLTAYGIEYLVDFIGVPISLIQLQNLILGDLMLEVDSYSWSESPEEEFLYLRSKNDSVEVIQRFNLKGITPVDVMMRNRNFYSKTTVTYSDIIKTNFKSVPTKSSIKIEYLPQDSPVDINVLLTSPNFPNNLTFPFSK